MVSRIKKVSDIRWIETQIGIQEEGIKLAEKIPFKLPNDFINLLRISDGGELDYEFEYYNEGIKHTLIEGISVIYGLTTKNFYMPNKHYDPFAPEGSLDSEEFFVDYQNLIDAYEDPPACFPENLVAFGTNGSGNMICFDYRSDPTTDNPPIVYWDHGAYIGEDVSFLANNFEEFIQMLRESDEGD
jgi:hypothetical protein